MYHHVVGQVVVLSPARVVLETIGLGFELSIPFSTFQAIQSRGGDAADPVRLLTHAVVREDSHRLFGFATEAEREAFRTVIGVKGVGPTIGLALLSSASVSDLAALIENQDFRALQRVRGIGRKLAERLVVELKDRVSGLRAACSGATKSPAQSGVTDGRARLGQSTAGSPDPRSEAVLALIELGYSRQDGEEKVESAMRQLRRMSSGESESLVPPVESILSEALRL